VFKTVANTPALALGFAALLKPLLIDDVLPGWYKELAATRVSVLQKDRFSARQRISSQPHKTERGQSTSSTSKLASIGRSRNWWLQSPSSSSFRGLWMRC